MKPIEISHKPGPDRKDGGGALVVTASTAAAKVRVLNHFGQEHRIADALSDDAPLAILDAGGARDRAYFRRRNLLDARFTEPYYALLQAMTGRDTTQETLTKEQLSPFYPSDGLLFTHYAIGVAVCGGALSYDFVVAAQDWNSRTARENAKRHAADCAQECLGMRHQEPEFLAHDCRKNPNWTKRHPVTPAVTYNNWFMKAICCMWIERHATPGQLAALELNKVVMAQARCVGELWAAKNLRRDWETPEITWEEFQTL